MDPRVESAFTRVFNALLPAGDEAAKMSKRKLSPRDTKRAALAKSSTVADRDSSPDDQISYSSLSLHQLFEHQTRQMLDRADLDEEQKQSILVAMSCPCCGAGAMSYTVKLKR
jgi:hypothetical protein